MSHPNTHPPSLAKEARRVGSPGSSGWRLVVLGLGFGCFGWGLGRALVGLDLVSRPIPALVKRQGPPVPRYLSEAAPKEPGPETPPSQPLPSLQVTAEVRDGGTLQPLLEISLPAPHPLEVTLVRHHPPSREILWTGGAAQSQVRCPLPLLPAGESSLLELRSLTASDLVWEVSLRGGAVTLKERVPPSPRLRSFRAYPEGLVTLETPGVLTWYPSSSDQATRIESSLDLTGIPQFRRENLIARDRSGLLHGFSLQRKHLVWTARGAGPLHQDPLPVPVQALISPIHSGRTGESVLEFLEAGAGIPMWAAPLRLPQRLRPDLPPCYARGTLLVPCQRRSLLVIRASAGALLHHLVLRDLAPLSAPLAISPMVRLVACGTEAGQIELLDFGSLRVGHLKNPVDGKRVQLAPEPITGLLFLAEDRLLATTRSLVSLRNLRGADLWTFPLDSAPLGIPAHSQGRILLPLEDGSLLVLEPSRGQLLERLHYPDLLPGSLQGDPRAPAWGSPEKGIWGMEGKGLPEVTQVRLRTQEQDN